MKQAYIDFIRYLFHPGKEMLLCLSDIDWTEFFQFCNRQGVVALVLAGFNRFDQKIPRKELIKWLSFAERIKKKNATVDKKLLRVTQFFDEKGYRSVILKGQANGLMYPHPEQRSPGDIDIWVEGNAEDIIKMVLNVCPNAHYSIHHIKMPVFKDISVEVHYCPIFLGNWFKNKRLQQYINENRERQFSNKVVFGNREIGTLTDNFNVIYQLLHMFHHFFETRNNFKQFIDYYYLLKRVDGRCNQDEIRYLLAEFGVLKYARGMMWVMKEILGLEEDCLYTEPDEKVGKLILSEAMHFGTFSDNKFVQVLQQFTGNLRLAWLFPSEVIISPLFLIWHQWWRLKMARALSSTSKSSSARSLG